GHRRLVSDWSSDVCSSDLFVAKLDPRSSPPFAARWAVRLGGPGMDGARSVAVDPHGDVAVAGFITYQVNGAASLYGEPPGTDGGTGEGRVGEGEGGGGDGG